MKDAIAKNYDAAASVLHVIRNIVGPCAYIAGGAARDVYLNRTPKDWDIFVPTQREAIAGFVRQICKQWRKGTFRKPVHRYGKGDAYAKADAPGTPGGYAGGMREEVLSVLKSTDGSVDVVFVDARFGTRPHDVVAKFDSSLALCWLDDGGRVDGLPLFWYSMANGVNIAIPGNYGDGKHFARTAAKLPGFDVVDFCRPPDPQKPPTITDSALIKRINRKLAPLGQTMRTLRGNRWLSSLGRHYIVGDNCAVVHTHCDLHGWGVDLGVITSDCEVTQ